MQIFWAGVIQSIFHLLMISGRPNWAGSKVMLPIDETAADCITLVSFSDQLMSEIVQNLMASSGLTDVQIFTHT